MVPIVSVPLTKLIIVKDVPIVWSVRKIVNTNLRHIKEIKSVLESISFREPNGSFFYC